MEKIKSNFVNTASNGGSAKSWFDSGARLPYDIHTKQIVGDINTDGDNILFVFSRCTFLPKQNAGQIVTFLPGFPEGSIGWVKIDKLIEEQTSLNRLFIEYIGQGDSDKPENYEHSTFERADVVEAIWKYNNIQSTFVVTFDFSSLVVMELLRRQQEKFEKGLQPQTIITKVLLINGGYFADGHSHPLMTTPLLKTRFGKMSVKKAQNSPSMLNRMLKGMWSREYRVSNEELTGVYEAITKRNGAIFLHTAAGFVDEHRANGNRLDLLSIFQQLKDRVTFHIIGSEKDQFEPRQVKLAKERLGKYGVDIRVIPGGHMITAEQPQLLTDIILELAN